MRTIELIYHHEEEGWWAESPDAPGYCAAAQTLSELSTMAREGVLFFLDETEADVRESLADTRRPMIIMDWRSGLELVTSTGRTLGVLPSIEAVQPVESVVVTADEEQHTTHHGVCWTEYPRTA